MNCFSPNKKIYFVSDLHLVMAPDEQSNRREKEFVQWLDAVKHDAAAIFLLGDIFDFWFEYRYAVPRGFVRLLGKLAELTDSGIPVHYSTGNHDRWMRDYFSTEMNLIIHTEVAEFEINGKRFLIGHGYKASLEGLHDRTLNFIFGSYLFRKLYAMIHPRWGIAFGNKWAKSHRNRHGHIKPFVGQEKELIARFAQKKLTEKHYDFFIFGHRHMAMDIQLNERSRYINTGEWLEAKSYAVFDGETVSCLKFSGVAGINYNNQTVENDGMEV
jgi:UDP-2,3-diacylglucosamine hydrolase